MGLGEERMTKWKCKSCGTTERWEAVVHMDGSPTDFCTTCHFTQERLE